MLISTCDTQLTSTLPRIFDTAHGMARPLGRHARSGTSTSCSSSERSRITRSRCRGACCSPSATKRCRRSSPAAAVRADRAAALRRGRQDHLQAPAPARVRLVAPAPAEAASTSCVAPSTGDCAPTTCRARAADVVEGSRARRRRAGRDAGALSRGERLRGDDPRAGDRRSRARDAGGERRGLGERVHATSATSRRARRTKPLNAVIVNRRRSTACRRASARGSSRCSRARRWTAACIWFRRSSRSASERAGVAR